MWRTVGLTVIVVLIFASSLYTVLHDSSNTSKKEIEAIVENYIREHPEVLLDSVNSYQDKQEEARQQATQDKIKDTLHKIENNDNAPSLGNPKGDVTIVEFFDYNCGYCRKVLPTILNLLEKDKNLHVIFKEYPILGPNSTLTTQASLSVHEAAPEKYLAFHQKVMQSRITGKESLMKIIADLGMDKAKIEKLMDSDTIKKRIEQNIELADEVGIGGTPAFIINGEFIPGAISEEAFTAKIADIRANAQKK